MDAEEAERYLLGDSPAEEAADLEEHLLVCDECREQISNTDGYLSAMYAAASEVRDLNPSDPGRELWRLLPGALVLACLILWGLLALGH
jgi:predicted anti-sigma-YlaC factor YlaD